MFNSFIEKKNNQKKKKKQLRGKMNLKGTSYGNGLLFAGFNQDQGKV